MAWSAVVLALLLAGCLRPSAADREPDRPSINADQPIFGELVGLDGTMAVSLLPAPGNPAPRPDRPVNCFVVDSADPQKRSFLGGFIVDLAWDPVAEATATLSVTLDGGGGYGHVETEGPSPLHIVLGSRDAEEQPFRTPMTLRVVPGNDDPLVLAGLVANDQPVDWAVQFGILESRIQELDWRQCDTGDEVPPPPVAAGSSLAKG